MHLEGKLSHSVRALYICYGSVTDPLIQSQALAYISGLVELGHHVELLSFEPKSISPDQWRHWSLRLQNQGIDWHCLTYHHRPGLPATFYDIWCGARLIRKLVRSHGLNLLHARATIPAAMALLVKKSLKCRMLYDIRGLLAEEREDSGAWRKGSLASRLVHTLHRACLKGADGVVVLTRRMADEIKLQLDERPLRVIPCCADLSAIRAKCSQRDEMRESLHLGDKMVMVYMGKVGSWYMLPEMFAFFLAARQIFENLHFLVLTQSYKEAVHQVMKECGLRVQDCTILGVSHESIGEYLAASDFAISFIRACPSKRASSPTKISEYLAAGLPVVSNQGIGDIDALLTEHAVGVMINEFSETAYLSAAKSLNNLLNENDYKITCQCAAARASLKDVGIPAYDQMYRDIFRSHV